MNSDIMQRYMSQAMKMYKAHLQAENRSGAMPVFAETPMTVPERSPEEANEERMPEPVPERSPEEANEERMPEPVPEMHTEEAAPMQIPEIAIPENIAEQLSDEKFYGVLTVNVSSMRGLFPVEGATVMVFYGPYENYSLAGERRTDESGKAVFRLETPSAALSENPDSIQKPYATYSLLVEAPGYLRNINLGVPVFAGVESIQDVILTSPSAGNGEGEVIVPDESHYDL